jgi:gamma-glutamylcyclotransferase (GGCT)/AIG2-like uncharacterized protein YtfP
MATAYFGYGANLNQETMSVRCPDAKFIGVGRLDGYMFVTNTNGVATIVPDDESAVWGAIWGLGKADEEFLDLFEGVKGGWYTKEYLPIVLDGNAIICLVYVASNSKAGKPVEDYFCDILEQCEKYGFDDVYVAYIKGKGWML